ncbi:hypothetical protein J1N35_021916 [Gossypium stocksii]|uniref:Uncharacterized protein n=1 Tax=Gossypium stocksii TaxID=47602 RepID=A0A9D3VFG4_9ROSI|nr:hypothetical protein J1N35_021916 [Gossypium stocksii]
MQYKESRSVTDRGIVGFNSIRFEHTLRSANGLAHLLATETLRRRDKVYLEMAVPEYAKELG